MHVSPEPTDPDAPPPWADTDVTPAEVAALRAALQSHPPTLPARYFYDPTGVGLYDQIVDLPEYYPSRVEASILRAHAPDIIALAQPRHIVELGSGVGEKIGTLLDAMVAPGGPAETGGRCTLFDIAEAWLPEAVRTLAAEYPTVTVDGILGDFTRDLPRLGLGGHRLVVFFAGTLGNLHPDAVPGFLRSVRAQLDPRTDRFLVGVDLVKDPSVLEAAYNDRAGVTAAFNRNILRVLNARFGATFDLEAFEHEARYDPAPARRWIEMRLRATHATEATVAGLRLRFEPGDWIRTELSTKYTVERLAERAALAQLEVEASWTDAAARFGVVLLRPTT